MFLKVLLVWLIYEVDMESTGECKMAAKLKEVGNSSGGSVGTSGCQRRRLKSDKLRGFYVFSNTPIIF